MSTYSYSAFPSRRFDDDSGARPATVLILSLLAAAAVLVIAAWGVHSSFRSVRVAVDGIERPVESWNPTVGGIIEASGISLGPFDTVALGDGTVVTDLADRIEDGETIDIFVATTIDMQVGGTDSTVESSAQTVEDFLQERSTSEVVISRAQANRAELPLVEGSQPVRVIETSRTGTRERLIQVPDGDFEAAYAALGSPIRPLDEVFYGIGEDGELEVELVRVQREFSTFIRYLPYEEIEEVTTDLFVGEYIVTTVGTAGTATRKEWVESIGDSPELRVQIHAEEIVEPENSITEVGSKQVTPIALVEAGIDPAARLVELTDDDGLVSRRYTARLGSITSAAEIRRIRDDAALGVRSTGAAMAPVGTYSGSDPQAIAQGMIGAYGWGDDQFTCLVNLWQRESGWNPYAENTSSGAYGIPQALPGNKMATAGADWRTNATTQITWGLGYIQGRYGNPCAAWNHFLNRNWY